MINRKRMRLLINELRSGDWLQCQEHLCTNDCYTSSERDLRYCCLGVMTAVYLKEETIRLRFNEKTDDERFLLIKSHSDEGGNTRPGAHIIEWYGLNNEKALSDSLPELQEQGFVNTMMAFNDEERLTFEQIANHIDLWLKRLDAS